MRPLFEDVVTGLDSQQSVVAERLEHPPAAHPNKLCGYCSMWSIHTHSPSVTRPATPLYPRVSAQLAMMLEAVLTGRFTAADAVRRTSELIAAITEQPVLQELGTNQRTPPLG